MAVQDYELLLKMRADMAQAVAQLNAVQAELRKTTDAAASSAAGATDVATAQTAMGETADQATARIHAMVQASLAAADAERTHATAATENAAATAASSESMAAQAAATAELVTAQNAAMAGSSRMLALASGAAAATAALQKGALTSAEFETAVNDLGKAVDAGVISQREYVAALELSDRAKITDIAETEAQVAANESAVLSSRAQSEIATATSEILSGNFGRLRRTGAAFANQAGLLNKIMTPLGLGIAAAAAAAAVLATAFEQGEAEITAYNKALLLTGNYAGLTVGQLQVLAQETANVTGTTQHAAAAVVAAVVQSGKFYGDAVGVVSQAAIAMEQTTGQAVDKTIAEFEKLGTDPVAGILKLNDTMHFLTQAVYDQITALQQRGEQDQAAEVAQKAYASAIESRSAELQQNLGALATVWHSVAGAAKDAWDAMLDIGRTQTPESRIAKLQAELKSQQQLLANAGRISVAGSGFAGGADLGGLNATIPTDVIKANIARIQQQIKEALVSTGFATTDERTAALHQRLVDQAINAQSALASGPGVSALQALRTKLDQLAIEKTRALYGVTDPDKRAAIIESFNLQVADAAKRYDAAQKKLKPNSATGIAHAQLSADVASVQNALTLIQNAYQNSDKVLQAQHAAGLISDKAYYDGLRADLDKFEADRAAELEKEKVAAQAHIVTQADRIKADQKVAEIDTEITKLHQDAAAKREQIDAQEKQAIERSQQAWDALRRSFETPAEVRAEDALAQIDKLNKMLANGVVTADQYHAALTQIGQHAVANALPNYQGVGAAVGGPFGELEKNFQAQQALLVAYESQKLALKQKFNDKDQAQEEAHQAALAQLDIEYAQKRNIIEQSRQQLLLTTTEGIFGQLASLSSSGNAKIAAIGKAAAIAQTLIKTYQSATEAYASLAGIPYIGPALGAAAAAAAITAGLANVAQIRAQSTGGYSEGGYTGPGGKHQVAGVVHAGEVVWSQSDVARAGGVGNVEGMRLRGFAEGGYVNPLASAPSPAQLGFTSMPQPRVRLPAAPQGGHQGGTPIIQEHYHVWDVQEAYARIAALPAYKQGIIHHVQDNPTAIQGKWRRR